MSESSQPARFTERIGAALIAPRTALATADAPDNAGRTGNDAALLLAIYVAAVYAQQLVVAAWLGATDSVGAGLGAFTAMIGRAVGTDLVVILAAGIAISLAAGRRRSIGRDFDLACVAYVPFVTVRLAAQLCATVVDVNAVVRVVNGVSVVWVVAVMALAVSVARRRSDA